MATGHLTIDLSALAANWQALDRLSRSETAGVVKANGYGLGTPAAAKTLAKAGARQFFVATCEEAISLRTALGPVPSINVFSGHMAGDAQLIEDLNLIPMLNSPEQVSRHKASLPNQAFGLQLDSGMNRLGLEPADFERDMAKGATLLMSHLACADEPSHPANAAQLQTFNDMTAGLDVPRSLAATGGILLGSEYHFDLTRPGIGLYGGAPFLDARPVVKLDLPVIQVRELATGEAVGYGYSWTAPAPARIATVSAGYADGLIRQMSNTAKLFAGDVACPLVGRVSMDLLTIDVTHLDCVPDHLSILCEHQTVDDLAAAAKTIGYEILTSLGGRYQRTHI